MDLERVPAARGPYASWQDFYTARQRACERDRAHDQLLPHDQSQTAREEEVARAIRVEQRLLEAPGAWQAAALGLDGDAAGTAAGAVTVPPLPASQAGGAGAAPGGGPAQPASPKPAPPIRPEDLRRVWTCTYCSTITPRHLLRIMGDAPHIDWQGTLDLRCHACYDELTQGQAPPEGRKWIAFCRTQWEARATAAGAITRQVRRSQQFQAVNQWIAAIPLDDRPEGRRKLQRRALRSMAEQMVTLADDFLGLPDTQVARLRQAFDNFATAWDQKAADPESMPCPDGSILLDHECQYLDALSSNVVGYFLCRRKDCLHVWRSVDWIKAGAEWHYLCPTCAQQYHP